MFGNVKYYFGKVVSLEDDTKLNRVRVRINGFTDKLSDDELPYYFPFYGLRVLPEEDDTVIVAIFDDNFTSGFYCRVLTEIDSLDNLSDEDYQSYIEVFKKSIGADAVEFTYSKSGGIEIINGNSMVNLTTDMLQLVCGSTEIQVDNNGIKLGASAEQYALDSKSVIEALNNMATSIQDLAKIFMPTSPIMLAFTTGCGTPFTAAFTPFATQIQTQASTILTAITTLKASLTSSMLCSKVVKIQ